MKAGKDPKKTLHLMATGMVFRPDFYEDFS